MQIRLYATLRPIAGTRSAEVAVDGAEPVGAVLRRLTMQYPGLIGEILTPDGGALLPFVQVFLNGRSIRDLRGLDTPVSETGELAVFPPVAGGSR